MVFRVDKTTNYTVMSNYHLREKKMSLKAKGLLSWMLSNTDEWDYSIAGIVSNCKENETAIKSALKELQQFGYLEIKKLMPESVDNNGTKEIIRNKIEYEYIIHEQPIENQDIENLSLDFLSVENQVQRNTIAINTKEENIKNNTKVLLETSTKPKKLNLWDKCVNDIYNFTDDEILRSGLIEFLKILLENYKERGMVLYNNSFKGKLKELSELSNQTNVQIQIVNQTIKKRWCGFYELKDNKKKDIKADIGKHAIKLADKEQMEESIKNGNAQKF